MRLSVVLLLLCLVVLVAVVYGDRDSNRSDRSDQDGAAERKNDKKQKKSANSLDDKPRKKSLGQNSRERQENHSPKKVGERRKTFKETGKKVPTKLNKKSGKQRGKPNRKPENGSRKRKPQGKNLRKPKKNEDGKGKNKKKGKNSGREHQGKEILTKKLNPSISEGNEDDTPKRPRKFKKSCPGRCVSRCHGKVLEKTTCEDGKKCCLSVKKKSKPKPGTKRYCKPLEPCNQVIGECRKPKTGCKRNEQKLNNTDLIQYCEKDCLCCYRKWEACLKTKPQCKKLGGKCQNRKLDCDGTKIKGKKYCKGKKCVCCTPPPTCKTKKKCIKKGGVCQSLSASCNGKLYTTKGHCKNKKFCGCCVSKGDTDYSFINVFHRLCSSSKQYSAQPALTYSPKDYPAAYLPYDAVSQDWNDHGKRIPK